MLQVIEIADADDARLDDFRDLKEADAASRGALIAEGVNVVERLLRSRYPVRAVFGVPARIEQLQSALEGRDIPTYTGDKWLLSQVAGFRVTRGVLASAGRETFWTAEQLIATRSRLVLLQALNDFENIGALFRNVAAFGADGVLLDAQCADPLYRRSIRVSMGHALQVPFAVLPGPLPSVLPQLHHAGIATYALTPRASTSLRSVQIPQRWALAFGAEGPGLSDAALTAVQHQVAIPMADEVDSLNVATAVAVALAHFTQR